MLTHFQKPEQNKTQFAVNSEVLQMAGNSPAFTLQDNRTRSVIQKKQVEAMASASPVQMKSQTIQLRLAIQTGGEDTLLVFTTAEEAFDAIYHNVGGEAYNGHHMSNALLLKKTAIVAELAKWINSSTYQVLRAAYGQSPVNRHYTSYADLGRAVLGEVDSKQNLVKETTLAQDTALNAGINRNIDSLMGKIKALLNSEANSDEKSKLTGRWANWHRGKYWPSYYQYGFWNVLNSPANYDMYSKVGVIHDITDYYWANRIAVVNVPADKQLMSSYGDDNNVHKYDMAAHPVDGVGHVRNNGTLNEQSPFVTSVRHHKMPMDVGPSFTTGRFMQLAVTVGATPAEKEAIAWGLFAYWNQAYYTSASGVHRFHFVMDMASNYGVPYTTFHYPNSSPDQTEAEDMV